MQNINTLRAAAGYHIITGAQCFDGLLSIRRFYHGAGCETVVPRFHGEAGEDAVAVLRPCVVARLAYPVEGALRGAELPPLHPLDLELPLLAADGCALVARLDVQAAGGSYLRD